MLAVEDALLKGALFLDVKLHHVLFNQKGKYSIKFRIDGSRGDLGKVNLCYNNVKQLAYEYESVSKPCCQDSLDTPCVLNHEEFRFEMPEEFSEGEVFLWIEAFNFIDNPLEDPVKYGEGKFLVFPCVCPVQQNDEPSTSVDRDACYNYITQIPINKLLAEEHLYLNIGQLQLAIKLHICQEDFSNRLSLSSRNTVPTPPFAKHINVSPTIDTAPKHPTQPSQEKTMTSVTLPMINEQSGKVISDVKILQMQEQALQKHRFVMKKMADDILKLKSEVSALQTENRRLYLLRANEQYQLLSSPSQLEDVTHADLVQRIVIIKGHLAEEIALNRELKIEIQHLQNQLIKKNEKEKDLYKLQDAHWNQQILLQKMQEKVQRTKTLEYTCKRQEKVILTLEEFLANTKTYTKSKAKDKENELVNRMSGEPSLEENRLQTLVVNYEKTSKAVEEMDRVLMLEKVRRAEGRVAALEKELLDNTRKWAKEKADLQLKLNERQASRQSSHWQYQTQEPFNMFDRTSFESVNHSRRTSPKLSPLAKK